MTSTKPKTPRMIYLTRSEWAALRVVARAKIGWATGEAIRYAWWARCTLDGTFLDRFVERGLLIATHVQDATRETGRKPVQFRTVYRLTALGEKAADFGEYHGTK